MSRAPRITLLGRTYSANRSTREFAEFERDWRSIPWMTYRSGFPRMAPYDITGDAGWGCMLRSAQMILAQVFVRHYMGRDFRIDPDAGTVSDQYKQILRWFIDFPSPECIYSLHNLVQRGMQYDKLPGEWYGPTSVGQTLRDLMHVHCEHLGTGEVRMLCTSECVVYRDEVEALVGTTLPPEAPGAGGAEAKADEDEVEEQVVDPLLNPPPPPRPGPWRSALFILIPVRLGLARINEDYLPGLVKCMQLPHSVGMIGGKRNHSVYFVGSQGMDLLVLDPHTVQPAPRPDAEFPSARFVRSVHCDTRLVLQPAEVDPSLAIGFYCRDRDDFERFCELADNLQHECKLAPFSVQDSAPDYSDAVNDDMTADALLSEGAVQADEDEEYVFC